MPTISVAMIVKNEAADLAQCLDTVKDWVDESLLLIQAVLITPKKSLNNMVQNFIHILIGRVLASNANVHNNMSPVIMFCGRCR